MNKILLLILLASGIGNLKAQSSGTFTYQDTCVNSNVQFNASSIVICDSLHPSVYFWNFGDGNVSTLANPVHIYSTVGSYYVQLTVADSCGFDTINSLVQIVCCDTVHAFLNVPDTICYLDSFAITYGGGTYHRFIVNGVYICNGQAGYSATQNLFNNFSPGFHAFQVVSSTDTSFNCNDTATAYFYSRNCCIPPATYITMPDTICYMDSFVIEFGGGYFYREYLNGNFVVSFQGAFTNTRTLADNILGAYTLEFVIAMDSSFTCTDTMRKNAYSKNCCIAPAGYLAMPDTVCNMDSFALAFGGGHYYRGYIDGNFAFSLRDTLADTISAFADFTGNHLVELVVSADSGFICTDTIYRNVYSKNCCVTIPVAYLTMPDSLCYLDSFNIVFGGGLYYQPIIDFALQDTFSAGMNDTTIWFNPLAPGTHIIGMIVSFDNNFTCADTVYTKWTSIKCCGLAVAGYLNIPDTVCNQDSFNINYGGGDFYQFIEDGISYPPFAGEINNVVPTLNDWGPVLYTLGIVVSDDSMFLCTDTVYRQFVSVNCCGAQPAGYLMAADTLCYMDSFAVQFGGGTFYEFIVDGVTKSPFQMPLAVNYTLMNNLAPGPHLVQLVISLDSSFACADTILHPVISVNCCLGGSFTVSDSELCSSDSVCFNFTGGNYFVMYSDTPPNTVASDTTPFSFCKTIGPNAKTGYHHLVAIIYSDDSTCTPDTISRTIYIKPACACSNTVDTCPAMFANFTYTLYSGYVIMHDISTGDPTFVEWYVGNQTFVTGPGDSLQYNFTHSGSFQVCLTAHHLIYGSDLCCIHDTCITLLGSVDTCNILNLHADFSYNTDPTSPFTLNFYPVPGNSTPSIVIWTFGDSTSVYTDSTGKVTHSFDAAGFYDVCIDEIWLLPGNYCCIDSQCYEIDVLPISAKVDLSPNPTRQTVTFSIQVAQPGPVNLSLYDALGNEAMVLINATYYRSGYYKREFDLSNLTGGVYTYRYKSADGLFSGKIIKQ